MKFISKTLFFIPLCVLCVAQGKVAHGKIDTKPYGKSVSEYDVYKDGQKEKQRGFSVKGHNALSAIKANDKSKNKKSHQGSNVKNSESFTVETVNNEPITNIDVLNAIRLIFFHSGKEYDKNIAKMMVPAVIESLEDAKIRAQCAKIFGLKISDNEIDQEVARLAEINDISVNELKRKIESAGISFKIFRENIRSRMIFQLMAQSLAEDDKVSKEDLENIKREQKTLINSERYFVIEIFRYQKESAEKISQLAHKGFDFSVLAENFSQAIKAEKRGTPRWIRANAIEPEVLSQLKKMAPGSISGVIKTKSGYKIIALIDTAAPGKAATSNSSFKILKTSVEYRGKLFTQADSQRAEELIEKLMKANDTEEFQKICKDKNLKCEEVTIQTPDPYYRELVTRSKESGKPAALQSPENEETVNVVLFLSEKAPAAEMPSNKELMEEAGIKKTEDIYTRSFKKIKSMIHIAKNQENIERLTK